jgi:hypothetical protein
LAILLFLFVYLPLHSWAQIGERAAALITIASGVIVCVFWALFTALNTLLRRTRDVQRVTSRLERFIEAAEARRQRTE